MECLVSSYAVRIYDLKNNLNPCIVKFCLHEMHLWYNNLHWYILHVLKYLDTKHLCVKKELWTERKARQNSSSQRPITVYSLSPPLILFLLYINLFFFELFSVDDSVFFFFYIPLPLILLPTHDKILFICVFCRCKLLFFFVLKPVKCHMPMRLFRQEKVL